ncbi:MAG: pantoate--beta-alanine ligase [Pirellulales bacterium]|nr:pantoate--beta-alanine ligase [Pirellulales bacterium]
MRALVAAARRAGKTVGVVPTMGALHAGHVSLVEACQRECDFTVVTIFVNRTQFAPHEDFRQYPRTLEADRTALDDYRVDAVFAPADEEIYRAGSDTSIDVGPVARPLEGKFRPTHFAGVATIVAKLFNIITPDRAYFGQKDYQQTLVIRRMTEDLDLPIEICVCPIVREADGLALSSRNVYLSATERRQALALSRSLARASELVAAGERDAGAILASMQGIFAAEPTIAIDYIALADPDTLLPVEELRGSTIAAIAARVGKTRLIDNRLLDPPA